MVLLGMDENVARNIYGAMIEEDSPELDEVAESALGELCNMVTGQAVRKLADNGRHADLTPPTVVTGRGASLSTLTMPRLVIPLATRHGDVQIDIAISDA